MIIEYALNGSKMEHKGFFETTGFWARYELEKECAALDFEVIGAKIFSMGSFAYYHHDLKTVELVYFRLLTILEGRADYFEIENIGYIRKI